MWYAPLSLFANFLDKNITHKSPEHKKNPPSPHNHGSGYFSHTRGNHTQPDHVDFHVENPHLGDVK